MLGRWFAIALLLANGIVHAGTISLPRTGQVSCYDASGNVIACIGTGQDGESRAGVAMPSPRFTDKGDGTVVDNMTGLMWLKDADCFGGRISWTSALAAIKTFNTNPGSRSCIGYTAIYSDWRMPNVNELMSLANFGESSLATWLNSSGFVNVRSSDYHSSTTQAQYRDPFKPEAYYTMFISYPGLREFGKGSIAYTWAVRGTSSGPARVPKTGQTFCYDVPGNVIDCTGSGQDGELRAGEEWPSPRFQSNGDGTVTDNLTGLIWLADAGCAKTIARSSDGNLTWQETLSFVDSINRKMISIANCANYTGAYTDWRLPNAVEMRSLFNGQVKNAADWLKSQGFRNALGVTSDVLQTNYYWTSTSRGSTAFVYGLDGGFVVKLSSTTFALGGSFDNFAKTNRFIAWPVRQVPGPSRRRAVGH